MATTSVCCPICQAPLGELPLWHQPVKCRRCKTLIYASSRSAAIHLEAEVERLREKIKRLERDRALHISKSARP